MSKDSLVPEWLRTGGASGRGPASPSRISSRQSTTPKSSPFRYSPEQLLKLFNPSGPGRAPQTLRETPGIYSPQPQIPMSLKEMTEREKIDLREKGINSQRDKANAGGGVIGGGAARPMLGRGRGRLPLRGDDAGGNSFFARRQETSTVGQRWERTTGDAGTSRVRTLSGEKRAADAKKFEIEPSRRAAGLAGGERRRLGSSSDMDWRSGKPRIPDNDRLGNLDDENLWDDPVPSDGMFEDGNFVSSSTSRSTGAVGALGQAGAKSGSGGGGASSSNNNAPNSGLFGNLSSGSSGRYVAPAVRERHNSGGNTLDDVEDSDTWRERRMRNSAPKSMPDSDSAMVGGDGDRHNAEDKASGIAPPGLVRKTRPPPLQDPSRASWMYRDTEGNIQGPFSAQDMSKWFASKMLPEGLQLKREADREFVTLMDVMDASEAHREQPFNVPLPPHLLNRLSGASAGHAGPAPSLVPSSGPLSSGQWATPPPLHSNHGLAPAPQQQQHHHSRPGAGSAMLSHLAQGQQGHSGAHEPLGYNEPASAGWGNPGGDFSSMPPPPLTPQHGGHMDPTFLASPNRPPHHMVMPPSPHAVPSSPAQGPHPGMHLHQMPPHMSPGRPGPPMMAPGEHGSGASLHELHMQQMMLRQQRDEIFKHASMFQRRMKELFGHLHQCNQAMKDAPSEHIREQLEQDRASIMSEASHIRQQYASLQKDDAECVKRLEQILGHEAALRGEERPDGADQGPPPQYAMHEQGQAIEGQGQDNHYLQQQQQEHARREAEEARRREAEAAEQQRKADEAARARAAAEAEAKARAAAEAKARAEAEAEAAKPKTKTQLKKDRKAAKAKATPQTTADGGPAQNEETESAAAAAPAAPPKSFAQIESEQRQREQEEAQRREHERMLMETVTRAQRGGGDRGGGGGGGVSGGIGMPWKAQSTWTSATPRAPSLRDIESELSEQHAAEQKTAEPTTVAQQLKATTRPPAGGWGGSGAAPAPAGPSQWGGTPAPAVGRGAPKASSSPKAVVGRGAPVPAAKTAAAAVGKRAARPKSLMEIAMEEEAAAAERAGQRQYQETAVAAAARPAGVWSRVGAAAPAAAVTPTLADTRKRNSVSKQATKKPGKAVAAASSGETAPAPITAAPAQSKKASAPVEDDDDGSFWASASTKGAEAGASTTAKAGGSGAEKQAKLRPEFLQWCEKQLEGTNSDVDVHTFVTFLMDIASPSEVVEYACQYLGESQASRKFAHAFVEKRENAYTGAIAPGSFAEGSDSSWQQTGKAKGKKKRRNQQQRSANELLNFSVGAPSGPNRGEIDFGV